MLTSAIRRNSEQGPYNHSKSTNNKNKVEKIEQFVGGRLQDFIAS